MTNRALVASGLSAVFLVAACHGEHPSASAPSAEPAGSASEPPTLHQLQLSSSAFAPSAAIPKKYSCEGDDVSPPLAWASAPPATKSFVLIVQDPDAPDPAAPKRVVTHWVLYNLPSTALALNEGAAALPATARQGKNEHGDARYMGPCPPIGRHRYFFKLYALDVMIPELDNPKVADVEQAMRGHVIGAGELIGTYQKGGG